MYYVWVEIYHIIVLNIGLRMRPRPTGPCVRARPVRPQPSAHPAGPPAAARLPKYK